jgi:ketosteroid isomerase-like protein
MKQRKTLKLSVCVFGALFYGIVGFTQPMVENDLKSEKKIIEKMNERYFTAIQRNDSGSFCSQYSPDCWIMSPGTSAYCGPDAAQEYFADLVESRKVAKGKFITVDLYGAGKGMLTEVGFYQLFDIANQQVDDGSYMVLWKKTGIGWKRFRESRITGRRQYACIEETDKNRRIEDAKKAIAESNEVYFQSFVKNDSSIFIERYAEDACIMAPFAAEQCGRGNAATFFREAYEKYGLRNGKFITTAVYGDANEFVTEEGLWKSYNSKGELFDDGKFLVLWKKTKDGWKMFRDSFSSDHVSK